MTAAHAVPGQGAGEVWIEHTDGDSDGFRREIKQADYTDDVRAEMTDHVLAPLTRASIAAGIVCMATRYATHFGDMLAENGDATTGDVLLQCALFGDLIYG